MTKKFESMFLSVGRRNQLSFERIARIIGHLPINGVFFTIIYIHTLWIINFVLCEIAHPSMLKIRFLSSNEFEKYQLKTLVLKHEVY